MDRIPPATGIWALAGEVALEKATKLSDSEAHEIWRAMRLLTTNKSVEGIPRAVIQLATDLNLFPAAREVVEKKAFDYNRNAVNQKP
jgi:hypothetical protein